MLDPEGAMVTAVATTLESLVVAKDSLSGGLSFAVSFCKFEGVRFAACSGCCCLVGGGRRRSCGGGLVFVLVRVVVINSS